jgi:hypothetical protein
MHFNNQHGLIVSRKSKGCEIKGFGNREGVDQARGIQEKPSV